MIVLRYYGDLSEDKIALAMGISQDAMTMHMARAMAALKPSWTARHNSASAPEKKYAPPG